MNNDILRMIYYVFFQSTVSYGIVGYIINCMSLLQTLQKLILKTINKINLQMVKPPWIWSNSLIYH